NKGIASTTSNNQINSLGVKVDSRNRLQAEVTLVNPYYGTAYQQGGLWLGLNDKTYLKLVVVGNKIELRREVNDVSGTSDQRITAAISGLNNQTVRLRLVVDPATSQAQGYYSTDGTTYLNAGASYATPAVSIAGMGLTASSVYAGIFATHRNSTSPVTYTFDNFSVSSISTEPAENSPPVVVTAPANQVFTTSQTFSFSGGQYSDPDAGDVLTYSAALAAGGALPAWLQFNATTASFTGTAPTTATNLSVSVTATDKAGAAVSASFTIEVKSETTTSNSYLVVENLDKFPANDRFVASLIQIPWRRKNDDGTYTPYNANHDTLRVKISNRGTEAVTIDKLILSNTAAWKIVSIDGSAYSSSTSLPKILSIGASMDVIIQFIAKDLGGRVKILNDKLTISFSDALTPAKEIKLSGLWQYKGEGSNEPYAVEVIRAFGFLSQTGFNSNDGVIDGNDLVPNSDEILSAFFVRADPSKPVSVVQMSAHHGCCSSTESFRWYYKGSSTITVLFTHNSLDGQSLLPRRRGSTTEVAAGTFSPSGAFGFMVASSYSDRTRNYQGKIGMRIWKAIDAAGNIIPNAYIIGGDYLGTQFTNYDYQDNIYYISNIRPEVGTAYYSELEATPSAIDFSSVLTGGNKSLSVQLKNLGKIYSNDSSDPSITIKSIQLAGPNAGEFTFTPPATTSLLPQSTINVSVGFRPTSKGLKNAALLVNYNNSNSPLRIPLYGIATDESTAISITKRIKSAADAAITIAGNVWEADISYRKGSVKLDKQVVAGPIGSTDDDILYQTYLSAAADLAETRYEIPISNGNYYVRLHFVENFFTSAGIRVFNISLENQLRLPSLDIYREVGYRTALVKDFDVNVTDGMLNIKFNPTANRLAIAGVEIYKVASTVNALNSQSVKPILDGKSNGLKLQVYPNPTQGNKFMILLEGFRKQEKVAISLYDIAGRTIHSTEVVVDDEGISNLEIAVGRHLRRGVYILKAQGTSGETRFKLVVE
ncbi:malectin domain-containing carbohydrate-binding protein, partial [Pontibacter vulgaris]|uniref:malectin domain-containing carbohydrate-binding protein n=1 Tax=Pontibacter vulgaris TaxID=2905679 RepID=UPI001FA6FBA1